MNYNKPMPKWKKQRIEQIEHRLTITLFVICLILGAFALGSTITWELVYGSPRAGAVESFNNAEFGLYAGVTDIDLENCYVSVIEEDKDEVTSAEDEEEVPLYEHSDYELLAKVIYRETGNQGKECMLYCGSVILNRVKSNRYPNTIYGVVFQHRGNSYQYSVARNKDRLYNTFPSDTAYEVAKYLLEHGSYIPDYVLYQHGNNSAVAGTRVYKRINGEVFSYDR